MVNRQLSDEASTDKAPVQLSNINLVSSPRLTDIAKLVSPQVIEFVVVKQLEPAVSTSMVLPDTPVTVDEAVHEPYEMKELQFASMVNVNYSLPDTSIQRSLTPSTVIDKKKV